MRPSSETLLGSKTFPTLVKPALSSVALNSGDWRRATALMIAALYAGLSSRSPFGAATTTLSTPPCSSANSDSIRSVAFCVSDPGISNLSFRPPPTVATRTISRAMMPSQARATRPGCVAHARIQRASAPDARRSCAALCCPFPRICSDMLRAPSAVSLLPMSYRRPTKDRELIGPRRRDSGLRLRLASTVRRPRVPRCGCPYLYSSIE